MTASPRGPGGVQPIVGHSVVSLFAGIGGFDLGFHRAGFRIAAHVEKDDNCLKLLSAKWPDAVALDDVCTAGAHNLPPCDVVTFGFPCQDVSVAGKRAGLAGGRSGLFYEATRIINEIKPSYCLFENVPGLLSSDGGRDFARVLMEMDRIGYCGAWRVLDAQWFGVAQRRRRVFGLFSRLDSGAERCAEILSLPESLRGHPAPRREAGQGVAGCLTGGADGGSSHGKKSGTDREGFLTVAKAVRTPTGGIDREDMHTLIPAVAQPIRTNVYNNSDPGMEARMLIPVVAGCLSQGAHPGSYNGQDAHNDMLIPCAGTLRTRREAGQGVAGCFDAGSDGSSIPTKVNTLTSRMQGSSGWAPYNETEHLLPVAHSLRAEGFDASEDGTGRGTPLVPVAQVQWASGGGKVHNPTAQALRSGAEHNYQFAQVGMQVRRLTPTECERLQGFPDGWTEGFSDSCRYKMLGNAVCVNVAEWIAGRVANEGLCERRREGGDPVAPS